MMRNSIRRFSPRSLFLFSALFAGVVAVLTTARGPIGNAVAAPAIPKSAGPVYGIHVQRTGDMPEVRANTKILVKAQQAQCGSALMKQTCQTMLSDPAASAKAKSRCVEMMSSYKLSGNLDDVGNTVIDEYFAPYLNRAARIVKTTNLRQTGICSGEVAQDEQHVITHYQPSGYTRHERKKDGAGWSKWSTFGHQYINGLDKMYITSFDAAKLSGKVTISASLGHKTLTPGRACEQRQLNAGGVEFVSCIHATGLQFPSHVTFEGEVIAKGKTESIEKFVSYAHNTALSSDLFFPKPDGNALPRKSAAPDRARPDPSNPTSQWCAAEKARTGVNPCEDNDE
jgi:hypothetical protein